MLSTIVADMAKTELGQMEVFLGELCNYESSAKALAVVEAHRSGIQEHSVGELMWKQLEPRRVTLWRVKAVAHCETELGKIVAMLVACGGLDALREMVDRCESRLIDCASIVGKVLPEAACQNSKDSFARIARMDLPMQRQTDRESIMQSMQDQARQYGHGMLYPWEG
jgi:hypothetical protein